MSGPWENYQSSEPSLPWESYGEDKRGRPMTALEKLEQIQPSYPPQPQTSPGIGDYAKAFIDVPAALLHGAVMGPVAQMSAIGGGTGFAPGGIYERTAPQIGPVAQDVLQAMQPAFRAAEALGPIAPRVPVKEPLAP